jgi:hypothetical protein
MPDIFHGHTLTSKIKFIDVVKTIKVKLKWVTRTWILSTLFIFMLRQDSALFLKAKQKIFTKFPLPSFVFFYQM